MRQPFLKGFLDTISVEDEECWANVSGTSGPNMRLKQSSQEFQATTSVLGFDFVQRSSQSDVAE